MAHRLPQPVIIDGVHYPSLTAAYKATGISREKIQKLFFEGRLDELHIDHRKIVKKHQCKPVVIRGVYYRSCKEAAEVLGLHPTCISRARKRGTLDRVGAGYFGRSSKPIYEPTAADLIATRTAA